ncbi:MAG: DNA gyrase inhibitor YacG [Porticoccus sp.]|nr:DNA gyrase inhibitor YacG [Porticoccus sp.]
MTQIPCPTCKTKVIWNCSSNYRPFCSIRCKQIDLGEWATESFRIPEESDERGVDNFKNDEIIKY